ncbi:MAG: cation transporter [Chloroflexota bacterium]
MSAEAVWTELDIPGIVDRPAVGTSCCVTSAVALVAQELWMLPGVLDAEIDERTGRVRVERDPSVLDTERLVEALAEIGYPAHVVVTAPV